MQVIQIIIPTYNRQTSIIKCIASVLNQKHDLDISIRIDVIENNSSDETYKLISNTYESHIKDGSLVIHRFNKTVPIIENWNRFSEILLDKTTIIKFLWSDDYLDELYFAKTVPLIDSGYDAVGCNLQYIDEVGKNLSIRRYSDTRWALLLSPFYKNFVGCPSTLLLRRASFDHRFNFKNRYSADLEHFLDGIFLRKSRFKSISSVLVKVTLNVGTETNSLFGSNEMIDNKIGFAKHASNSYFKCSLLGSIFYIGYKLLLKLRFKFLKRFF